MDCRLPSAIIAPERASSLTDPFGRRITYLRLSVTDHCNLRCHYCMGSDVKFLPKAEVLSIEEMERVAAAFIHLGVRKLRLTGGEPLVRRGVMGLVESLGAFVAAGDLDELTLTTNGTLLARHASALAAAGVRRVNVSLDSLDAATFQRITDRDSLADVLAGIDAARSAGLAVRVNTVVMAGINDTGLDGLIRWCGGHDCDMALIEMMPLGPAGGGYLPLDRVRRELEARWTLLPLADDTGGPGRYWRVAETGRRLGFITPMSHGFCATCNRVRLTCTGRLVLCLGEKGSVDLRPAVRDSGDDTLLEALIVAGIAAKPSGHHFGSGDAQRMWQLGG